MNPDGTDVRRLTNNPAGDEGAVWSPDGSKIVFKSNRNKSNNTTTDYDLYLMDADGTNVTAITDFHPSHERGLSFSPDGSKISFSSSKDGNFEIYTINITGTNLTRLTSNNNSDTTTHWSPDGKWIAFSCDRGSDKDICKVEVANPTNEIIMTANSTADEAIPAWKPDGSKMAFRKGPNTNFDLWLMNPDGSNPARLTNNPENEMGPAWSPDGAKIAFSTNRHGNSEIYIMNADGSNQTRITSTSANEDDVDWGINQESDGEPEPTSTPQPTNTPTPLSTQTPTPSITQAPGNPADVDNNGSVNLFDLSAIITHFNETQFPILDPQPNGKIDIFDYSIVIGELIALSPQASPTTISSDTTPTIDPSPSTNPIATPIPISGEIRLMEWTEVAAQNRSGFLEYKPAPEFAQGNWVTPENYAEGKLYFRARVNGIPVEQTGMKLGFCFWQGENNTPSWGEECASSEPVPGVVGAQREWTRTMTDLNPIGGKNNSIEWDVRRWKYGIIVRNKNNKPVSAKSGMNWNGEDPTHWYPLDIRFTVVLVKKDQTFSGWHNYDYD